MWLTGEAAERGIGFAVDAASVGFIEEVGADRFLEWTRGASVLFCNRDGALALSGTADLAGQMAALGRSAQRIVIKLGPNGAALGNANGVVLTLPAPAVEVVDTTGAGDAFAAAFISAELRGESSEPASRPASPPARRRSGRSAGSRADGIRGWVRSSQDDILVLAASVGAGRLHQ